MNELVVFGGIGYGVILLVWTIINFSSSKELNERSLSLAFSEHENRNTFKRIKSVIVTLKDGEEFEYEGVRTFDIWEGFLALNNEEGNAEFLVEKASIQQVLIYREGNATCEEIYL